MTVHADYVWSHDASPVSNVRDRIQGTSCARSRSPAAPGSSGHPSDGRNGEAGYFETLEYPLRARLAQTQGVVVVRVKLDSEGKVVSSAAISGAKSLIRECLSNSKKWLFRPNPDAAAVIVYQFKIEGLVQPPLPEPVHVLSAESRDHNDGTPRC